MGFHHIRADSENTVKLYYGDNSIVNWYQIYGTDSHNRKMSELVNSIRDDIFSLTKLPENWDGHDGIPVKSENAIFALKIVKEIIQYNIPKPSVVPGSDGSLQLEWHLNGFDIEIDIVEPTIVIAERIDLVLNREFEISILDDFSILTDWIMDLLVDRRIEEYYQPVTWIAHDSLDKMNQSLISSSKLTEIESDQCGDVFTFIGSSNKIMDSQSEYKY